MTSKKRNIVKEVYERFKNLDIDEYELEQASSLDEINALLGTNWDNENTAKTTKSRLLKGLEQYSTDIATSERELEFSDFHTADLFTIEISFNKSLKENESFKIIDAYKKGMKDFDIDLNKDIKFYIQSEYKDGKIATIGSSLTQFDSIDELIDLIDSSIEIEISKYEKGINVVTIGITAI